MAAYTCICCADDHFGRPYTIANDKVCGDCLQRIFDDAVEHEANFPPKWGGTVLDPEHFRDVLSPRYIQRYAERKEEWSVEALNRVYCNACPRGAVDNCGKFLGSRSRQMALAQCGKCRSWTCRHCRQLVAGGRNANHRCDPNLERQERARAYEGLERGKQYQMCPRCDRPYALEDGCNHVQCKDAACKAYFCFLCGAACDESYDHFKRTPGDEKCPLNPNGREMARINAGERPMRPVYDLGLGADLQGVPRAGGNVAAQLQRRHEEIVRGLGGIAAGPAGQQDGGGQQALVPFNGGAQNQNAIQRAVPAAGAAAVPLDDRLTDAFDRLQNLLGNMIIMLEFYSTTPEVRFVAETLRDVRILLTDLTNRRRLARASAEAQAEHYQWAVEKYRQLYDQRDQSQLVQIALSQPHYRQWIMQHENDPRMVLVTGVAEAERPGGLFEQQRNFWDQLMGVQVHGALGQRGGVGLGQQPRHFFNPHPAVLMAQQLQGLVEEEGEDSDEDAQAMLHPRRRRRLGQQVGGMGFQPPMELMRGWGGGRR